MTKIFIHSN